MDIHVFEAVSYRGWIAYCIKCLQAYLREKYPTKDFSLVLKWASDIVSDKGYIDENTMRFMEILPEHLHEFSDYAALECECLTEAEYRVFLALIPRPEDDPHLNQIMKCIFDVASECGYGSSKDGYEEDTLLYIEEVMTILREEGLAVPDPVLFLQFSAREFHRWGRHIKPSEYL